MLFIFVKPVFVIILLHKDKIMVNGVRDVENFSRIFCSTMLQGNTKELIYAYTYFLSCENIYMFVHVDLLSSKQKQRNGQNHEA